MDVCCWSEMKHEVADDGQLARGKEESGLLLSICSTVVVQCVRCTRFLLGLLTIAREITLATAIVAHGVLGCFAFGLWLRLGGRLNCSGF